MIGSRHQTNAIGSENVIPYLLICCFRTVDIKEANGSLRSAAPDNKTPNIFPLAL